MALHPGPAPWLSHPPPLTPHWPCAGPWRFGPVVAARPPGDGEMLVEEGLLGHRARPGWAPGHLCCHLPATCQALSQRPGPAAGCDRGHGGARPAAGWPRDPIDTCPGPRWEAEGRKVGTHGCLDPVFQAATDVILRCRGARHHSNHGEETDAPPRGASNLVKQDLW